MLCFLAHVFVECMNAEAEYDLDLHTCLNSELNLDLRPDSFVCFFFCESVTVSVSPGPVPLVLR